MVRRLAFTMIELIFAIVIIAISVLSLPMMSQITSKNIEGSLTQEAIFAASAELNQVISLAWDENSMEDNASLSRVVWSSAIDCDILTKLRSGHIVQPYHRRCADANGTRPTTALNFGSEGDLDDLDDINQTQHNIFTLNLSSATGYKKVYKSQFTVTYADFDPAFTPSNNNIKRIDVNITESGNLVTTLSTFSSNIGEIDYYKRSY